MVQFSDSGPQSPPISKWRTCTDRVSDSVWCQTQTSGRAFGRDDASTVDMHHANSSAPAGVNLT
jgi:hypothetical protein